MQVPQPPCTVTGAPAQPPQAARHTSSPGWLSTAMIPRKAQRCRQQSPEPSTATVALASSPLLLCSPHPRHPLQPHSQPTKPTPLRPAGAQLPSSRFN